jgi:HAD superfamily hydrolase (TIGR01509 family)
VKAVVFDVGETLVDETRNWELAADACGVPRFTLMALVGAAVARDEPHTRAFEWFGVELQPRGVFLHDELYGDAVPCLEALRARGLIVGAVGNMAIAHEEAVRARVDFVASSERWGVEKPAPEFFARVAAEVALPPAEIAYVGDRLDNDVLPAKRAGMTAVHVRRGPWGYVHALRPEAQEADLRVDSLLELRDLL